MRAVQARLGRQGLLDAVVQRIGDGFARMNGVGEDDAAAAAEGVLEVRHRIHGMNLLGGRRPARNLVIGTPRKRDVQHDQPRAQVRQAVDDAGQLAPRPRPPADHLQGVVVYADDGHLGRDVLPLAQIPQKDVLALGLHEAELGDRAAQGRHERRQNEADDQGLPAAEAADAGFGHGGATGSWKKDRGGTSCAAPGLSMDSWVGQARIGVLASARFPAAVTTPHWGRTGRNAATTAAARSWAAGSDC